MKRLCAIALILCFIFGSSVAFADDAVFTERKNTDHEAWLWEELSQHSPNDIVTAGILSYFWRESQYRSDAVAGWWRAIAYDGLDLCSMVLEETDEGLSNGSSEDYFISKARTYGGYGLGQWYSMNYLEELYKFARQYGTSIGDAQMQCEFVFMSLQDNEELWEELLKCDDPDWAGRLIAVYYDGTEHGATYMGYTSRILYEKYHEKEK